MYKNKMHFMYKIELFVIKYILQGTLLWIKLFFINLDNLGFTCKYSSKKYFTVEKYYKIFLYQ